VGDLLTLKASINYTGRTSMVVGVRVEAENIITGEKRHCNSSYFTMVAKDETGKNLKIPGLIIKDKEGMRRFARSKERKLSVFQRDSKYDAKNFKIKEYSDFLKDENMQLDLK
jgi:acyl-CoA hydrolase